MGRTEPVVRRGARLRREAWQPHPTSGHTSLSRSPCSRG